MRDTRDSNASVAGLAARYDGNFEAGRFDDLEWAWVRDRRMFVVGHTPGGAPFGCLEDELVDLD